MQWVLGGIFSRTLYTRISHSWKKMGKCGVHSYHIKSRRKTALAKGTPLDLPLLHRITGKHYVMSANLCAVGRVQKILSRRGKIGLNTKIGKL